MTIAVNPTTAEAGSRPRGVPGPARPAAPAHVIRDDAEAIRIAQDLANAFRAGASERDRTHARPLAELDAFSQSGLWSINVPEAFGGPELSYRTLAQVIAIIAAADPSIAQIAQNHLGIVAAIRTVSDEAQQADLFAEVLKGTRFGNAFSEKSTRRAAEFETRFTDHGDHVVVRGQKFYATGALLAHLVPIVALDDEGRAWYAIAERDAPGLTVIDDWSSFGQRGTASGTVLIEDVRVEKSRLVPAWRGYAAPSADGAIFQIIQAAVDAGIGRAALDDTIDFVREKARPWIDSGQERASDDPYTIRTVGDLTIRQHAAEALLDRAGWAIDAAVAHPTPESVAAAQIATAEAKVLTTEGALAAANALFELSGTRSTLAEHNLDRHWRNARTHTLHDPVRWKVAIVGNHALNGVNPPFHAWS
ncbi:SfnB family sulfur acquisition oxidoreductase [Methylobacterium sp. Leaf118]|uniref:SfnB family sulfur acquisition oxidoreductase n=1 Tax=Methylobacterium sp. Leaf118 TaxID=2876562 RepID=UPI001E2CE4AF|nr:SfnB family sulfur acquisition oxidoreductase [Methylobacterium sp. Leaf118]